MKSTPLLLALALSAVTAGAVAPALQTTTPTGLQRGTEAELRFNGTRLADTKEVLLYESGVKVLELKEIKDNVVVARVKVEADSPLGEHKVRLRTASGVSDLRTFYVGPFPQIEEKEPNSTVEKAQAVPLNMTVLGTVLNEDLDFYRIEVKKGQPIAVEVEGMRLGRTMFDPYVAIRDASGKVLAKADDTALFIQDAYVTFVAPADGEYIIEVRETSYGGAGNPYRLHVGSFPRPSAVFPAGGKAEESLEVKFIGDAGGDFTQTFLLPQMSRHKFGVFAERNGLTSPSANIVRVTELQNVIESEPNDDAKTATPSKFDAPVAFNGIIAKKGDADWFRFKAKKGQTLDINVYARRIRSQLDTVLLVADATGKTITSNDDSGGADSYLRFNVPADGEYCLKVTDHLGNGGSDCTYRVELTLVAPEVTTYIADTARYDTQNRKSIVVARGNRFASLMNVRRKDFSGDLEFGLENFPSGVTVAADLMPKDQTTWPVVFEAAADAPVAGRLANITVQTPKDAKDQLKGGIWQNYDLVQQGNDGIYYQVWTDKIAAVVVEELPFKIRLEPVKAPLVQSGTLDVKVIAERKAGFDEPIRVQMLYNPPGVGTTPDIVIAKGENSAIYTLNANAGAQIRKWKIAMLGSSTVNGGTAYASTQLADIEVAPAFVSGKIIQTNTLVGTSVKLRCELEQKTPFEGKAEIKLVGLPSGVSAAPKFITKDDKMVIFDLNTATNATKGMHRSVFCSMSLTLNGQTVAQSLAAGGAIRLDVPRTLVADAKPAAAAPAKKLIKKSEGSPK